MSQASLNPHPVEPFVPTPQLRWLCGGGHTVLQQAYIDVYTGDLIWMDVPRVLEGDPNGY